MSETYVGELVPIPPWPKTMKAALPCDGKPYSVASYPELFDVIGYRHGGGAGVFHVPNMNSGPQHYAIRTHSSGGGSSGGTGSASGSTSEVQ